MLSSHPNSRITCDLCRKDFVLTASALKEANIELMRDGYPNHKVTATFLTCPCCGKQYPVIVDDDTTLPILQELKELYVRGMKYRSKNKKIPERLRNKQQRLSRKLGFNRRKLAEKYNKSYYQLEDGSRMQLDYCYREHMHG